jgi:predicted regulator of Ras-like GTPase activity (Roadblock/LC7/MglB family)
MFKKALEEIIETTEGSIGAMIMGTDGIAVEQVLPRAGQDANLDVAAAEFTSLVRSAQHIAKDIGMGKVKELVVALENANIMVRLISDEYFLILAMLPESNMGRGRFKLRKAELLVGQEFKL